MLGGVYCISIVNRKTVFLIFCLLFFFFADTYVKLYHFLFCHLLVLYVIFLKKQSSVNWMCIQVLIVRLMRIHYEYDSWQTETQSRWPSKLTDHRKQRKVIPWVSVFAEYHHLCCWFRRFFRYQMLTRKPIFTATNDWAFHTIIIYELLFTATMKGFFFCFFFVLQWYQFDCLNIEIIYWKQ